MTYIKTDVPQPGIVELLFYKGRTGKALSNLAHTLLHDPSPLTRGERELIAAHVSRLNDCEFCHESHAAVATLHLNDNGKAVECLRVDIETIPVSEKMKRLLAIAGKVQAGGKSVTPDLVEAAKKAGATDEELHDTVLIAAAFCMYNRYVDGLATNLPEKKEEYVEMGERLAKKGYTYPPLFLRRFVVNMMKKQKAKKNK